jgi:hypothetical protein
MHQHRQLSTTIVAEYQRFLAGEKAALSIFLSTSFSREGMPLTSRHYYSYSYFLLGSGRLVQLCPATCVRVRSEKKNTSSARDSRRRSQKRSSHCLPSSPDSNRWHATAASGMMHDLDPNWLSCVADCSFKLQGGNSAADDRLPASPEAVASWRLAFCLSSPNVYMSRPCAAISY